MSASPTVTSPRRLAPSNTLLGATHSVLVSLRRNTVAELNAPAATPGMMLGKSIAQADEPRLNDQHGKLIAPPILRIFIAKVWIVAAPGPAKIPVMVLLSAQDGRCELP